MLQRSLRGHRLSLDRGRALSFPLAEVGTRGWFKAARAKVQPTGAMLLTATMKNQVRTHHGLATAAGFKAPPKWRRC